MANMTKVGVVVNGGEEHGMLAEYRSHGRGKAKVTTYTVVRYGNGPLGADPKLGPMEAKDLATVSINGTDLSRTDTTGGAAMFSGEAGQDRFYFRYYEG